MTVLPLTATPLEETVATFRSWLHMDDADSLLATLAAVAANRLAGDPVWLLLVGPPGGGKSEILNALSGLPYVRTAGTLTEASLLSGTPKKEHANASKGGLLREIGDFGIIVAKDFGSILSMNRDARAQVMAALREVYDGSWTRLVGSDGGRAMHWAGKVGFVGGVTPTIDRHHAVMGAMGERFLFYRLPEVDPKIQARRALAHAGQEKRMRLELAQAVAQLLDNQDQSSRELEAHETDRLIALGTLVVRARSAVERDGFSRDIELVPDPEAPTRLPISLSRLLIGLHAINVSQDDAWRVVDKVGFDSVPALRLSVIKALRNAGEPVSTTELGTITRYPAVTTRRACEDLTAHGLLECHPQGEGKAHLWELTDFTTERLDALSAVQTTPQPDTAPDSDPSYSGHTTNHEHFGNGTQTVYSSQNDLSRNVGGTSLSLSLSPKKEMNKSGKVIATASTERIPFAALADTEPDPDEHPF